MTVPSSIRQAEPWRPLSQDDAREAYRRVVYDRRGARVLFRQELFTIYDSSWSPLRRFVVGWLAAFLSAATAPDSETPPAGED